MIDEYVDAAELRRLLSSLAAVVGALLLAALFASIVVPGLRNANKPPAPMPVNPAVGEPGWLDPTAFPPERGKEVPPVDARALIAYSPEWIARGHALFVANCTSCHGDLGKGDGPAAATMNPRPRNFTSPDGWKKGYDLASIYETLRTGLPGTSMAAFDYFSRRDRMALAHYVQALGTFPHGQPGQEALAVLTGELSAAGEKTPNRIPVSMAMARLVEEYSAPPALTWAPEEHGPGVETLRKVILDPARAARTLAGNAAWRQGAGQLAGCILPGIPGNGFAVVTADLGPQEWQALEEELVRRLPAGNSGR